uniref:6-bladed beta-propeller n=1 Tax=candidate division WOR-3 bacterium TaxID=2052148 RepID=A0A7C4U8B4_UNCW3
MRNKIFIFLLFIFYGCSVEKSKINVVSTESIEIEINEYVGNIVEGAGNYIYIYGLSKPLVRLDIFSGKIDTIFFHKDGYIFSVNEKDGYLYFIINGILKRYGDGIKDICFLGKDIYFKFLNDELIISQELSSMSDYFSLINIKKKEKINNFGEMIEYPDERFKKKLGYDRFTIPYPDFEWNIKGTLLVVYEYFFDRLKAYDVLTGKIIKTFGIEHKGWELPPVIVSGKGRNKIFKVAKTPAAGIAISDKYIFICLEKYWLKHWKIVDKKYEDRMRKLYRKGFFFVDVYRKTDFSYIGTFFPLNDKNFFEKELSLRLRKVKAENDSTLVFYLQDNKRERFFRKVKVVFNIKE